MSPASPSWHPDRLGEPVALTVNLVAPTAEGRFEIDAVADGLLPRVTRPAGEGE